MKNNFHSNEDVLKLLIFSSTFFLIVIYIALVVQLQSRYNEQIEWLNAGNEEVKIIQCYEEEQVKKDIVQFGSFKITHYCGCSKCCGKWSEGSENIAHGSQGTLLTPFKSIAVDPKVIPYGTILWDDEGNEYVAEDCGGAIKGNRIDLFVGNHKEALRLGVIQNKTIYWEDN